ncbi:MAG: hypothetical protein IAB19_08855 [Proteobacteria bacterium]|uniref:AsmA-like C-terminal domain-containing protein n=1 Tax=Candidatus Avisuccinivibrio stercorigallinarum TaxID=2840704 RepID=A0A9D9DDA5_9GAMM|nr:hypothetical protein [Candidatus Avisuccinivibrio stercorigallinarum]
MAFRPPRRKTPSKAWLWLRRITLSTVALLIIALAALLLLVNGERIREPLEQYLTKLTGLETTIAKAEFSPLYPQVIKLTKVSAGSIKAGEIYLEYDLSSLLSDQPLHLYDLYLKDLQVPDENERRQLFTALAPKPLVIDALRLNSIPIAAERIKAKSANLRLNDARIDRSLNISFSSGQAQLSGLTLDRLPVKSLRLEFTAPQGREAKSRTLNISALQAEVLGGMLSAQDGYFSAADNKLAFRHLNASRLILKDGLEFTAPYTLEAEEGSFSDLFYAPALPQPDAAAEPEALIFSDLSGSFSSLRLTEGRLELKLTSGSAAEIALPQYKLNLTEAKFSGTLTQGSAPSSYSVLNLNARLQGRLWQGSLDTAFTLTLPNAAPAAPGTPSDTLTVHELDLKHNVLEFDARQYEALKTLLYRLPLHLESARAQELKVLSFIPTLPLSIESLSLQGSALKFADGRLSGDSAGLINVEFSNLLYSDLLLRDGMALTTLTDEMLTFALPQLTFASSSLSASAALSFNQAPSYLLVSAPDFRLDDLNSSLSPHLFSGVVNFNLDLKAPGPFDLDTFASELSGSVSLKGDSLLISRFGLDLINGGDSLQPLTLTKDEILTALSDADIGLYQLNLKGSAAKGRAALRGSFDTPASHVFVNFALDLDSKALSGQSNFSSLSGDAKTRLTLQGTLTKPGFLIEALERGMHRPGLFIPSKMGKQPTDPAPADPAPAAPAPAVPAAPASSDVPAVPSVPAAA